MTGRGAPEGSRATPVDDPARPDVYSANGVPGRGAGGRPGPPRPAHVAPAGWAVIRDLWTCRLA